LVLSVLGTSVLSLLFTIHSFVLAFIVLEFAIGALGVAVGPITRACVSDEVPKTTMGFHASLWWSFFTVGRVIGPLVGAYIAQMWSFADSFWASTILSIGLSAFILLSFPAGRKMSKVAKFSIMRDVKLILNLKSARLLFVTTIFVFASRTLITSFLPLYASEQIKMSTVNVGVLYSLFSGAQLFALPLIGWFSDGFGRKRTTVLGLLASASLFLLYFAAHSPSQLMLVTFALGIGTATFSLLLAMVPDVVPGETQGAAIGIYGSSEDLGTATGPLVLGFVWTWLGPVFIFAVAAFSHIVGAILAYRIKEKKS